MAQKFEPVKKKEQIDVRHPCIECLLDTERYIKNGNFIGLSKGNELWYSTYKAEAEHLGRVLARYQPRSIIEGGSGCGRVIQLALDSLTYAEIIGIERNPAMYEFLKNRFESEPRVKLREADFLDFLVSGTERFDMALCMMNTLGNINNPEIFRKILERSKHFVFSLYDRASDEQRMQMYDARGHTNFSRQGNGYLFRDWWVDGLVSRSYTIREIEEVVRVSNSEILEIARIGLLYFVVAKGAI